jgi:hypothetical protein
MNIRPDAKTIKAKRAEIRRRYARGRPKFSLTGRRVDDLEEVYRAYFGKPLPADDNGRELTIIMAHHLAGLGGDPRPRIAEWFQLWAPWLSIADAREITGEALLKPRRWKADTLAWRLKLKDADRTRLGVTTIGSIDVGKDERIRRREQRKYARLKERRRRKGMQTRAQYEAQSISRTQPWAALGMSRAAWYRAGKPSQRP